MKRLLSYGVSALFCKALTLLSLLTITSLGLAQDNSLDHLKCYEIKDEEVDLGVFVLENQFGLEFDCKASVKAKLFCEETRKNGVNDIRGTQAQRFLCYKIKCKEQSPPVRGQEVLVEDQAGERVIVLRRSLSAHLP